jgi:hypothetical protein
MTRVFEEHFARNPFRWVPINLQLTARNPWCYLHLGNGYYLQWNMLPEYDEQIAWSHGRWLITRQETDQERDDRLEMELELEAMEVESNRYTQWSY